MKEVRNQNRELERGCGSRRNTIVGLSIALGVFAASTLGLGIAYGISQSNLNRNETQLENVYQKNLYDLVESVNNSETKLSKVLASKDRDFQNKTLVEVSQSTTLCWKQRTRTCCSGSTLKSRRRRADVQPYNLGRRNRRVRKPVPGNREP